MEVVADSYKDEQDQTLSDKDELVRLQQRVAALEQANASLRQQLAEVQQSKESVEQERHRFHYVLMNIPASIILFSGPQHIGAVTNPAYLRVVGRDSSIIGRTVQQIFPELEGQGLYELLDEVYTTGKPFLARQRPVQLVRDGDDKLTEGLYDFIYHPMRTAEGQIEGVFVYAIEVTEEVKVTQALERERQRLREVFLNAPAAIGVVSGPDYIFELTNPPYLRLVGRQNSIIGLSVLEALPEVREQGFIELLNNVRNTGKPFVGQEMPIQLDRNGNGKLEEAFLNFVYQPLFGSDGSGKVESIFAHVVDVTEQVRARQTIELQRQRLQELFMNAPAGIAVLRGPNHIFELANPPYMQLAGRQSSIIGLTVAQALPEVVAQGFIELLDGVYQTGKAFIAQELAIQLDRNGDGKLEEIFLNFVYQPLFASDGSGKAEGIFVHVVEVTEQVKARQQIEQLSRLKDDFLAIASHDLRTPVTSIKGYLQLLQRNLTRQQIQHSRSADARAGESDTRLAENNLQVVTRVLTQVNRLNELINRLLDFSRIAEGQLNLQYTHNANLVELVLEVVTNLSMTTEQHQVLMQPPARDTIRLSYDEARLEQVLNNLIGNAIKYSPPDTTITVGVEAPHTGQSEVIFWIRDEGYGIDPEQQIHLFERFYQIRNEHTEGKGGLGLGLYITAEIVKQHGGRIWVKSALEQGSTFYVALPTQLK